MSASGSARTSGHAEATVLFSADNIRERLDNDEYALAVVLTSTRLENILSRGIKDTLDLNESEFKSLFGNNGFGYYVQLCYRIGIYEEELGKNEFDELSNIRNNIVHNYGYLSTLEDEQAEKRRVENAIDEAIDFIERVER